MVFGAEKAEYCNDFEKFTKARRYESILGLDAFLRGTEKKKFNG